MKVKISTRSWHYRLLDFYDFSIPNQLCNYFWKVIGTILATPFIIIGMLIASLFKDKPIKGDYNVSRGRRIGRIFSLFALIWTAVFGVYDLYTGQYILAGIMFGLLGYMIIMPILKLRRLEKLLHPQEKKKPKEPNIAWEYLKAKKNRYCPLIEFTGMNEIDDGELKKWR